MTKNKRVEEHKEVEGCSNAFEAIEIEEDTPLGTVSQNVANEYCEDERIEVEDDNEERTEISSLGKLVRVLILAVLVLLILFVSSLYPSFNKVKGNWETITTPTLQLKVDGQKFEVITPSSIEGAKLLFRGQLKGMGANRYRGENIEAVLKVNKEHLDEEDINSLKKKHDNYLVEKETKKYIELKFHDNKVAQLLENQDVKKSFEFVLTYKFGQEKRTEIEWSNAVFSEEIMRFKKYESN